MINFNRIVVYGCSYTAGEELIDHLVFDKLSEQEVNEIKRKYTNHKTYKFYDDHANFSYCTDLSWFRDNRLRKEQEKYAWSGWLSKHYGVECVNRALGGSSLEYAVYKLEEDIIAGQITDTDLVIIAATTPSRNFWLSEKGQPKNILHGYHTPQWWTYPNENEYNNYILKCANTYQIFWEYYRNLRHIDLLSSRLDGRILWWPIVSDWNMIKECWYDQTIEQTAIDKMFLSTEKFSSRIKNAPSVAPEPDTKFCGFGHVTMQHHIFMANKLVTAIEEHYTR